MNAEKKEGDWKVKITVETQKDKMMEETQKEKIMNETVQAQKEEKRMEKKKRPNYLVICRGYALASGHDIGWALFYIANHSF